MDRHMASMISNAEATLIMMRDEIERLEGVIEDQAKEAEKLTNTVERLESELAEAMEALSVINISSLIETIKQ